MKRERTSFDHRFPVMLPQHLDHAMRAAAARVLVTNSEYVRRALKAQLRRDQQRLKREEAIA